MVGGSNFGELTGALFVFLFTNLATTPMPWLRFDTFGLLIVWYLAFWYPFYNNVSQAWVVAATMMPMSFGWAAGDISLSAYMQALLHRQEHERRDVGALVTVMAFLYSTYIITYSIASPILGSCTVFAASFIPRGAFSFNPQIIEGEDLEPYPARDMAERPPSEVAKEGKGGTESMKGLKVGDDDWFSDL
ncbi:hypothetical protein VE02_09744 [Pseudogymnoascus sp. 03VT05]|nr:hypothetical protein VE02_09744 [Pseudogymnoascus sp. 03VT05]